MSDYETLNVGPISRTTLNSITLNPNVNSESSFKEYIKGFHGLHMPVIDDPSFKVFDTMRCPNCPNGGQIMTTNDGNRNQSCLSCNTLLMRDGKLVNQTENKDNTTTQQKFNNIEFSSFMPDHMQDYMKELHDIHNRIHNTNHTEQKDEKYTDGELEIYSEDDPDMPDYMKELSELVNQKK